MSFADNLKMIRKEEKLSQEDLAEMLDISRQAVSKWEQGTGYPEAEKIMLLSKKLNISLDYLMCGEYEASEVQGKGVTTTGKIAIKSEDGKSIVTCYKVSSFSLSNLVFKSKDDEPQYALFGIDSTSFFSIAENRTLLGWYANEENIKKEIEAILNAIKNGVASYELKFAAKVKKGKFFSVKLDQ